MTRPPEITPIRRAKWMRYMIAASSGFGKTVHAGSAERALFLTTDPEGTASAAAFGSTAEEWQVQDRPSLEKSLAWVESGQAVAEGYETLVVDNITEIERIFLWDSLQEAAKANAKQNRLVPDKPHYLISHNGTIDFVKRMIRLPINVIFTVHRQGMEGEDGEQDFWSVAIQGSKGQVAQMILGYMNVVGMGEVINDKEKGEIRRIYFTHWQRYRGKDRFNVLGGYQDDITVPEMCDMFWPEGQDEYIRQCDADDAKRAAAHQAVRPRPRPRPVA